MNETNRNAAMTNESATPETGSGRQKFLAAGSVLGGVLASTCCIAPLLLVTLGVGGAWMGRLTALAPYQPYFVAATLAFLAGGFWYVYWKPRRACDADGYCATDTADRVVKVALWVATGLVALALGVTYLLPYFL